ncbi:MAG: hypothetical protein JEY71_06865 [Sphaerochaeta sp.]|nr:hypothetical protein [Sphaerochaeta sp.]
MDKSYSEGNGIAELLCIVKNHIVLLLVVVVGVVALSLGYALISTPSYTATTTITVEPIASLVQNTGNKSASTGIVNEIQYFTSTGVVAKALGSMELGAYTRKDGTDYSDLLLEEKKFKNLLLKIELSEIENTNQVTVSFEHVNQDFANAFIAALHTAFDAKLSEISDEQLDKEHGLLKTMLRQAESSLVEAELARDELQSRPIYVEYNANNSSYHRILNFLEILLREVDPNIIAEDGLKTLGVLRIVDPTSVSLVENYTQEYSNLVYFQIAQLIKQTKANEVVSEDSPGGFYWENLEKSKLALLDHLSLIQGQAEAEVFLPQITSSVKVSFLADEKQYYFDSLKEFRSIALIEEKINYDLNQYKGKVLQYTNQLKSFEENRSIALNPTSVVEPVQIKDLDGNTPTLLILALGLFLGLALGFLCILLYDTFSDSLIDEFGIKKFVGEQIPIWTTIPKNQRNNNHSSIELGIFISLAGRTSEAFSQLAGIVQHGGTSNGGNVYCFSSLGYRESGVSIVLNLALSIMKNGKKVLMIGTNSEETMYPNIYDSIVASDTSVKKVSLEDMDLGAVKKTDTKLPLLHLASIDGEPHELSIILNSEAFSSTVQTAAEAYDIILIDGPTFRSPSNLLAVAKNSTGLVLNIRQGIASKKAMKQLLATVSVTKVPILGIVFNTMFGRPFMWEKYRIQKQDKKRLSGF